MRCSRCGVGQAAMKTCRWRNREAPLFACCDGCHAGVAPLVWVVAGLVPCFGTCGRCGEWFSVRDLEDRGRETRRPQWRVSWLPVDY